MCYWPAISDLYVNVILMIIYQLSFLLNPLWKYYKELAASTIYSIWLVFWHNINNYVIRAKYPTQYISGHLLVVTKWSLLWKVLFEIRITGSSDWQNVSQNPYLQPIYLRDIKKWMRVRSSFRCCPISLNERTPSRFHIWARWNRS